MVRHRIVYVHCRLLGALETNLCHAIPVNPKDFILFGKSDFRVQSTWKDNTGEKNYLEDTAFPTLTFPSDHGILATVLEPLSPESCEA